MDRWAKAGLVVALFGLLIMLLLPWMSEPFRSPSWLLVLLTAAFTAAAVLIGVRVWRLIGSRDSEH